jgi:hypothetical protein
MKHKLACSAEAPTVRYDAADEASLARQGRRSLVHGSDVPPRQPGA